MELSERIQRWRESRDLTQAALAEKLEVSPSAVAQWELGETKPTTANVEKLAIELAGSLHEFYGKPPAKKKKAS